MSEKLLFLFQISKNVSYFRSDYYFLNSRCFEAIFTVFFQLFVDRLTKSSFFFSESERIQVKNRFLMEPWVLQECTVPSFVLLTTVACYGGKKNRALRHSERCSAGLQVRVCEFGFLQVGFQFAILRSYLQKLLPQFNLTVTCQQYTLVKTLSWTQLCSI